MHDVEVAPVLGVLEGHPLQHVRDAGGLPGLVDGAGVDEETDARRRTLPETSPAKQLQNESTRTGENRKEQQEKKGGGIFGRYSDCVLCITGMSSEAMRRPLGSVVTRVGLRLRLSGRHGGRSSPGRGRRSEPSHSAKASAAESRRAAAAGSCPHTCVPAMGRERRSVSESTKQHRLSVTGKRERRSGGWLTRAEERSRGSILESIGGDGGVSPVATRGKGREGEGVWCLDCWAVGLALGFTS